MRAHTLTFAAVLLSLPSLSSAAPADAADAADRWDLSGIYPSVEAWRTDTAKAETQFTELARCKGQLGTGAPRLRQCLDLRADIEKRLARLSAYASLRLDEDTGVAENLALTQQFSLLLSKYQETASFVRPELLAVGKTRLQAFFKQDAGLAPYRYPVDTILRAQPHVLDAKGEKLAATLGLMEDTAGAVYGVLSGSEVPWPEVTLSSGEDVRLDQAAYTKYRAAQNRDDRKLVYDRFWGTWKAYQETFGATLYGHVKTHVANARARHYPSALAAALDADHIPVKVYETLIEQTHKHLPTLHRYFRLRAKMLGLDDLRYYDTYPPLVKSDLQFPLARGQALMLEAVKPLGTEYVEKTAAAFDGRWMDAYPRPRKRSGAYMNPAVYDLHPFLLLNYNDDYESVSTLAHEWGHALHSVLANAKQPYPIADYSNFIAEIPSTLNEALLLDTVLRNAASDEEKLFYLGSALENLRLTYFRQVMFAEFESEIHKRVEAGEALTGEAMSRLYGDLLRRYQGEAEGVMTVDEPYTMEWAYIPHFYTNFYVFKYATCIAASSLFAQNILDQKPGARERYLAMLRAGGSADAYALVKQAGVDLATAAPYDALAARMDRIMDQMEAILGERE